MLRIGAWGERLAAKTLRRSGYRIVDRNFTCPAGEIDIIAADGDVLVFVEVKTRASDEHADPENNVNAHKRGQLTKAARYYLIQKNATHLPCRFDVMAVVAPKQGRTTCEHFVDAFPPTW